MLVGNRSRKLVVPLLALLLLCSIVLGDGASAGLPADTVIVNARIYTADPAQPWVEALALRDGQFVQVGTNSQVQAYVGDGTRQLDMSGRMLMPGINDAHSHPWQGGVKTLYNCTFSFDATPDEIARRLRECVTANPDAQWLIGGQWTSDFFRNHEMESPRKFLDAIASDRVILLHDDAGHNAWVNSKALVVAGITAKTSDPEGGTIVRDDSGEPNGLLYESARTALFSKMPEWTQEQYAAGITEAVTQANSFGITGINEARAEPQVLAAYTALDRSGKLTLRVTANHQTPRDQRDYPLDVQRYSELRTQFQSQRVNTSYVKIFLDGVPTASRSALMLEDYLTDDHHPEATRGFLLVDPDILTQDLIELDKAGFTVKIHTAGDGSVRVTLDALEQVRKRNGNSGLRHELAHAGFIDPADLERFARLNVTADLSPYIWYPSPIIDSIVGALGERGRRYFPVKDLLDSGANVLMGSDWPSAAKDLSPWHAIEALVTRRNPFTDAPQTLWPQQAISLEQALAIATRAGALAMRLEQRTGSIEIGKSADFLVLDRNLFEIPVEDISNTQVQQTWFEGSLIYQR